MPSFDVTGMSCDHCVHAVTDAVRAIDPSAKVTVDLATGRVDVDSFAPLDRLIAAIEGEGYGAKDRAA